MRTSIPLFTLESRIKRRLRSHLRSLGFQKNPKGELSPPGSAKEPYRDVHRSQREELLRLNAVFVANEWPKLRGFLAGGADIRPTSIEPRLEIVKSESWQSNLFRLATLSWSVPVSQGYGRRLRFLVWDGSNEKLMGVIALCDPVFNLRARDEFVGWTAPERSRRLVSTLSAYVLGALPPYNMLLGGKLIACLVRTREVRDAFSNKYRAATGIISRETKKPSLVLVTTSSALGRSSVYNRLVLGGCRYFSPIGYTKGWGHFHVPGDLFKLIREFLLAKGHAYARNNRFGDGPNWRLRASRQALSLIGVHPNLLRHGLAREVFVSELAINARKFLRGEIERPDFRDLLTAAEVGQLARQRWIEPRAKTRNDFQAWNTDDFLRLITLGRPIGNVRRACHSPVST